MLKIILLISSLALFIFMIKEFKQEILSEVKIAELLNPATPLFNTKKNKATISHNIELNKVKKKSRIAHKKNVNKFNDENLITSNKTYHENGFIKSDLNYKNGQLISETTYDDKGFLSSVTEIIYLQEKKNRIVTNYYPSGSIKSIMNLETDLDTKTTRLISGTSYLESGIIDTSMKTAVNENGELNEIMRYHESGQLKTKIKFNSSGKPQTQWNYDFYGNVLNEITY